MLKKLPIVLTIVVIISLLCNSFIPLSVKQLIYACSLTLKSIVVFILPFLIFGLLFKTFVKLADHALSIILLIFGCLCTSNFFNTFVSSYIGSLIYRTDFHINATTETYAQLEPTFTFLLPTIIKNDYALFSGIVCGILFAMYDKKLATQVAARIDKCIQQILRFISYIIPLFIIGFIIKCASDGVLVSILKNYSQVLLVFIAYASVYTFACYYLVNRCVLRQCLNHLQNMFPAFITAFSTISSVVTMPITMLAVEKNVKNKELSNSVISATVNIHLLGDCLAIPILAYALLKHYGMPEPSLLSYFTFTIFFVIAKFSVAAVPAGGIIIMTPILEKYLGFTPEMSTLIIAIYVIFDPFVTCFNVLGNGALAKLIDNLSMRFTKIRPAE